MSFFSNIVSSVLAAPVTIAAAAVDTVIKTVEAVPEVSSRPLKKSKPH